MHILSRAGSGLLELVGWCQVGSEFDRDCAYGVYACNQQCLNRGVIRLLPLRRGPEEGGV